MRSRYSQPAEPGRGGGRRLRKVFSFGTLGYVFSVRRLRVLIKIILPELMIFYGFGLKQGP